MSAPAATAPAVEREIAFDMVRRGLPLVPLVVVACGLVWGLDGAATAAVGVAIVFVNLVAAALSLAWAAKVSPAALMATALGGFLFRMIVLTLAVWGLKQLDWVELGALAATVVVTQLALLFWEARFVSASLAYPGLKPARPAAR
jgi:hypothetical protein